MAPTDLGLPNWASNTVLVFGLVFLVKYGLSLFSVIFDFIRPGVSLNKFGAKKGAWAVVTGASDGIGRIFALELAKAGFNIVLVARTESKLQTVADEIAHASSNVKTLVHVIDLGNRTANGESYISLAKKLEGMDVGVLINNAGRSYSYPEFFPHLSDEDMELILDINLHSVFKMTKIILPGMIGRGRGLVLNIGSFAGTLPTPLLAVYSGTKAGLEAWSQALGEECKGSGVIVNCVNTYFVTTKLSKFSKPTLWIPRETPYVRSVLRHINRRCGSPSDPYVTTPYFAHAILNWIFDQLLPSGLVFSFNRNMMVGLRKKALRKRDREGTVSEKVMEKVAGVEGWKEG